jgi:SAM-dependent methyltransferase
MWTLRRSRHLFLQSTILLYGMQEVGLLPEDCRAILSNILCFRKATMEPIHRPSTSAREQFGKQAAFYAISPAHRQGENLDAVRELAERDRFRRAIDIATGAGFMSFALAARSDEVLATDIALPMLEQTRRLAGERRLGNVGLALTVAEFLPFLDGSLDAVACRTAAHHFEDLGRFLDESARVLRPGGVFLLVDTVTPEMPDTALWMNRVEELRDHSHVRDLAPSEWHREIQARGLRITDSVLTRTRLTFNDWVFRSGSPPDEVMRLRRDFQAASAVVREAFEIAPTGEDDFSFSWPSLVVRAVKG